VDVSMCVGSVLNTKSHLHPSGVNGQSTGLGEGEGWRRVREEEGSERGIDGEDRDLDAS
jgi:hypothetical protein